jgi:hypothetical protein
MAKPSPEYIVFFPGTEELIEVVEPEIDRDEIILQQNIRLEDWRAWGEDLKRRIGPDLPQDLHFGLCELLRGPRP